MKSSQDHKSSHESLAEKLRASESLLEAERHDASLLHEISTALIHAQRVEPLFATLVDSAASVMASDFASMQRYSRERGGELVLLAHRGFPADAASRWKVLSASAGTVCSEALKIGRRIIVSDVDRCDVVPRAVVEQYLRAGIRSVQSTPLFSRGGDRVGMISTHWRDVHEPSTRDLRLLDVLARQAADLIERTLAEEALRQEQARKDQFLSLLAHELRNPLAPIRDAVRILQMKGLPPDLEPVLGVLDRQSSQMSRLLDDLLDVGRIGNGRLELRSACVDLASVIRQAVETAAPMIERYGHTLEVSLPARSICVHGDQARLVQVFANLLNNAAKFSDGPGAIAIHATASGQVATVAVRDHGVGIPREMLTAIFEPFVQVDASPTRSRGGLGIGLALVKRLVEMHQGEVIASSAGIGKGSEFIVRLPAIVGTASG